MARNRFTARVVLVIVVVTLTGLIPVLFTTGFMTASMDRPPLLVDLGIALAGGLLAGLLAAPRKELVGQALLLGVLYNLGFCAIAYLYLYWRTNILKIEIAIPLVAAALPPLGVYALFFRKKKEAASPVADENRNGTP